MNTQQWTWRRPGLLLAALCLSATTTLRAGPAEVPVDVSKPIGPTLNEVFNGFPPQMQIFVARFLEAPRLEAIWLRERLGELMMNGKLYTPISSSDSSFTRDALYDFIQASDAD